MILRPSDFEDRQELPQRHWEEARERVAAAGEGEPTSRHQLRGSRKRVRQAEADADVRTDLLSTQEREEIRRLRKENAELRRANEILRSASLSFARDLDPDRPK